MLRELILKSCRGQYIQKGDILDVPFVGRTIRLRVGSVASSADGRRPCENKGGGADQSKRVFPSESSIIARLKEAVLRMEDGGSALYQICPETKIEFGTAAPTDENDISIAGRMQQLTLSPPTTNVTLGSKKQVAGLDAELKEIKSILLPSLSRPEIFFSAGWSMKPPKGVLLFGPPGTGKSRLAAHVGDGLARINIDGERDILVETVPCVAIQSYASIVGRAERELCRIFDRAEARASRGTSTLLIVDDVHLICPRRGAVGSSGGGSAIASTLLALLDGIGSEASIANNKQDADSHILKHGPGTVMILATTSDPSLLDPALRRPGRLDIEIEIPIPDDAARADILEFLLDRMSGPSCDRTDDPIVTPALSKQELSAMARLAKGFTGADCTLALKEALRSAILRSDCDVVALTPSLERAESKGEPIQMTAEDISHAIRITKPSTIRAVTVEVPRVPWSAIGGMEHVKMLLREAVELPVTHAHHFESLSVPPPKGVLLYGPPGCSKTLMARALATEGHMNFLAVKGPELLSKWLGESERALASLFRRARQASPCIIFFDEIDSIATKRGGGGNSGERLLSQLLTELDGVSNTSMVEKEGKVSEPIQMTAEDISHAIRITKPSTIRAVTVEVPRVPWSAIGGMEHVKMLLREAVELPVTHAHHFESLSVPPPKGVLLYGPPGCSKTLMARALATEGHMNFLAVKGPELLSKWLGESERALASLFRRARQASPCIIFFDEIDSIATKRGGGGNSGERLLSQLLTELDGVSNTSMVEKEGKVNGKSQRVVVVAATNRPDLLDPALTRPGRIDRKIYVGLPDEESRRGILKVGLKGKACNDDIDVSAQTCWIFTFDIEWLQCMYIYIYLQYLLSSNLARYCFAFAFSFFPTGPEAISGGNHRWVQRSGAYRHLPRGRTLCS